MYRKQRHAALRVCYIRINRKTIPHFFKKDNMHFSNVSKHFLESVFVEVIWRSPQTQLRLHERSHQGKKAIRWSISLNLLLFWVSAHTLELASFRRFKSIFLPASVVTSKSHETLFEFEKGFFWKWLEIWHKSILDITSWSMKTLCSLWQTLAYWFPWINV